MLQSQQEELKGYAVHLVCKECDVGAIYTPDYNDLQNASLYNFYYTCEECGCKTNHSADIMDVYGLSFDNMKEKLRTRMLAEKIEEPPIPPSPPLKISYLIAFATKVLEEHGDLEVYAGHEGQVTQLEQKDIKVAHPYMYVDPSDYPLAFMISADGF